jgi:sterol desaturase/sphingolipid hydroxylase (fatty acid hydroxylase superfamily)
MVLFRPGVADWVVVGSTTGGGSMYQSKWGYYADFVVYPGAVLALTYASFHNPHSSFFVVFLLACLAGLAGWTLVEYAMHRFVFHAVPGIAQMHDRHHANPNAFVGTPSWLTLPAFVLGIFVPLWTAAGLEIASGIVSGLMAGFTWYVAVHDALHRWPLDRGSLLYKAKLRHACHHATRQEGNFGVTTGFWDRVFGTAIEQSPRLVSRLRGS